MQTLGNSEALLTGEGLLLLLSEKPPKALEKAVNRLLLPPPSPPLSPLMMFLPQRRGASWMSGIEGRQVVGELFQSVLGLPGWSSLL